MEQSAPLSRKRSKGTRKGSSKDLHTWLAFAFGVTFASVLLYLATFVKNPEPHTVQIYLTVMALAAGGVGAMLPGFMEVQYKGVFRAGGAMALFALVYFNAPAISTKVVRTVAPTEDGMPVVQEFLKALDSGEAINTWKLMPDAARLQLDHKIGNWERLYKNAIEPLGAMESRTLVGEGKVEANAGVLPGVYKGYTFKTKYSKDSGYRMEVVTLRGNDKERWEIYQYNISISTFN